MAKRALLFAAFFVVSFGVLNLAFPITNYFKGHPTFSKSYILSNFLLLICATTLLAVVAYPLSIYGKSARWVRITRTCCLYFVLVSTFAIACSGLGFGLSLGDMPFFGRLSFFFMEWEWLRFILETALPITVCAGFLYYEAIRTETKLKHG